MDCTKSSIANFLKQILMTNFLMFFLRPLYLFVHIRNLMTFKTRIKLLTFFDAVLDDILIFILIYLTEHFLFIYLFRGSLKGANDLGVYLKAKSKKKQIMF